MDIALIITALVVGYVFCGWLAYGITRAYFDRKYPELGDHHELACQIGIGGPAGLIVAFVCSGFCRHGFKWRGK